jgi:hypothetical protein
MGLGLNRHDLPRTVWPNVKGNRRAALTLGNEKARTGASG